MLLTVLAALIVVQPLVAQVRYAYTKGQSVSPAYEGWTRNEDGSFTLYFGYMNPNWQEEFDVPVGPDNNIEPGGPDQGQPTHFYPRRNPFLFTFRVPADFGSNELVWTLTTNGRTEKAYASLKTDYQIDKQVISMEVGGELGSQRDELRENIPPELSVEGAKQRTARVGEPLTLVALAGDPDNMPMRLDRKPAPGMRVQGGERRQGNSSELSNPALRPPPPPKPDELPDSPEVVYRPPVTITPRSGPGLRLSWIVYRGKASAVAFDPEQMKTWTDTRSYANSPWSPPYIIPEPPPSGKWIVLASFQEPGTYVLRAVVSDSSLFAYDNVTVNVTP